MTPTHISNTLSNLLGAFPYIRPMPMSEVPAKQVSSAIVKFMADPTSFGFNGVNLPMCDSVSQSPEEAAFEFYMLNHAVTLIRARFHPLETLPAELVSVVKLYMASLTRMSPRMFYYLTLICTRESRHNSMAQQSSVMQGLAVKYGFSILEFHSSIKGKGSHGAAEAFKTTPPTHATMGPYTSFLSDAFYQGSYSSGYGGKAWGAIADVLRDFVVGKLSAELMLDTAFTLCHNNGPIFNKGMLFDGYGSNIYRILDVQRSGQIPELLDSEPGLATTRIKQWYAYVREALEKHGFTFSGPVDWVKVEALGSVKKYPSEIAKQLQGQKVFPQATPAKPVTTAASSVGDFIPTGDYYVYPGLTIKKGKVKR